MKKYVLLFRSCLIMAMIGTAALFTVEGVEGQIKRTLVSGLSDAIAESKIPAIKPGNKVFTISIKMRSCEPSATRDAPSAVFLANNAMTTAAPRVQITQIMATVALFLTSFALRILIKRTKMCGIPK